MDKPLENLANAYKSSALPVSGDAYSPGIMNDHLEGLYSSLVKGTFKSQLQQFCVGIDRYNKPGLTFITRPRCNLSDLNIGMSRQFAKLVNTTNQTIPTMTRMLLDTKYANDQRVLANEHPLIDAKSPFLTPLMNGLVSISGWPDKVLQTTTTEGGFHHEDQTYAKGTDSLRKTVDLVLNFEDQPYGPIAMIKETWVDWIDLAMEGSIVAYKEDIDQQRMCYTSGIYRFVMDPSKTRIIKCTKGTGCFPKVGVDGSAFNIEAGGVENPNMNKFSVPFTCNHVMYNDYLIFIQFNLLMKRYCPSIVDSSVPVLPDDESSNFLGLPYIIDGEFGPTIVFKDVYGVAGSSPSLTSGAYADKVKTMLAPLSAKNRDELLETHIGNDSTGKKDEAYDTIQEVSKLSNNKPNPTVKVDGATKDAMVKRVKLKPLIVNVPHTEQEEVKTNAQNKVT